MCFAVPDLSGDVRDSVWKLDVEIWLPFSVRPCSIPACACTHLANTSRFGDENVSESSVSISSLCVQLDSWMKTETTTSSPRTYTGFKFVKFASDDDICYSLKRAILSYAARWLYMFPKPSVNGPGAQAIARKLWREARSDMLKVLNRPSKWLSRLTLPSS